MPFALLLAMQAAGMVTDYIGTKNQQRLADYGERIQQAGIEANIAQTRLETEDASLEAMRNLRQNLGSQIAIQAARGNKIGAGSAFISFNESSNTFNADERMRRLNLMGKENQLRSGSALSRLQNMSENTSLWRSFGQRSMSRFPSSAAGWKQGMTDFKEGFGLTSAGT